MAGCKSEQQSPTARYAEATERLCACATSACVVKRSQERLSIRERIQTGSTELRSSDEIRRLDQRYMACIRELKAKQLMPKTPDAEDVIRARKEAAGVEPPAKPGASAARDPKPAAPTEAE